MSLQLVFAAGRAHGSGSDEVGGFNVSGTYGADTGKTELQKSYRSHNVRYSGRWDGQMISGTWRMGKGEWRSTGPFEIWPESESTALEQLQEEAPEVLALPAGPGVEEQVL